MVVETHCKDTIPKIRNKYSQKWNWAASFQLSSFMLLWAIYILYWVFPQSVCICFRKINRWTDRRNTDTWMWKLGLRPRSFFSGNTELLTLMWLKLVRNIIEAFSMSSLFVWKKFYNNPRGKKGDFRKVTNKLQFEKHCSSLLQQKSRPLVLWKYSTLTNRSFCLFEMTDGIDNLRMLGNF